MYFVDTLVQLRFSKNPITITMASLTILTLVEWRLLGSIHKSHNDRSGGGVRGNKDVS